jgi:hypothetical protein
MVARGFDASDGTEEEPGVDSRKAGIPAGEGLLEPRIDGDGGSLRAA